MGKTPKAVEAMEMKLTDHVMCPICMLTIYKCVATMPCFHNFCSSCCSEWMACRPKSRPCPVCCQKVTGVIKNHAMDAVIETIIEACPELARSDEEMRDMDKSDKFNLGYG